MHLRRRPVGPLGQGLGLSKGQVGEGQDGHGRFHGLRSARGRSEWGQSVGARFSGARLEGADMRGEQLADAKRRAATSDGETRWRLPEPESATPDVLTFLAVDSEIDDMLMGAARRRWAPAALAEKGGERAEYLDHARAAIEDACRSIAARFA